MEEGGTPKRKCELCAASFMTTKTLRGHYMSAHNLSKEDEIVKTMPKSPKKNCGACGKAVSNIYAHRANCKKKPNTGAATTPEGSPIKQMKAAAPKTTSTPASQPGPSTSTQATAATGPAALSNEDFLAMYKQFLSSRSGGKQKTEKDLGSISKNF